MLQFPLTPRDEHLHERDAPQPCASAISGDGYQTDIEPFSDMHGMQANR
jgi:hypothetical protein